MNLMKNLCFFKPDHLANTSRFQEVIKPDVWLTHREMWPGIKKGIGSFPNFPHHWTPKSPVRDADFVGQWGRQHCLWLHPRFNWVSPMEKDRFVEYQDTAFLKVRGSKPSLMTWEHPGPVVALCGMPLLPLSGARSYNWAYLDISRAMVRSIKLNRKILPPQYIVVDLFSAHPVPTET